MKAGSRSQGSCGLGSQPGDLRLLHSKSVARVHGALAHCLSCRLELPAGPFGERRGPEPPNMSWAARRCSRAAKALGERYGPA